MNAANELLEKQGWNLFFAHYPDSPDGNPYRIYSCRDVNEVLGYGKTPDEAIQAALKVTAR